MESKERRKTTPNPKVPRMSSIKRNKKVNTVKKDMLMTEEKIGNVSNLEQLFDDKNEEVSEKNISKGQNKAKRYKEPTKIPTDDWKQSFRMTNSREIVSLFKFTTVSHNALLRLTGSYSTKILSNLKAKKIERSGIESKATKLFYDFDYDISHAISNDLLSYIPYSLNYLSNEEEDITKKIYIDNLLLVSEKLYFSLFMYNNEVLEIECIVLDKENLVRQEIEFYDKRDSLKIFVTEEKNTGDLLSAIKRNYQQNFLLIVLHRNRKEIGMYMYSNEEITAFTLDKLKEVAGDKVRSLEDESEYEEAKSKYIK
ncbi:hypothetical protein JNUCC83_01415 [Vagococcus sp. JNUCC 83]